MPQHIDDLGMLGYMSFSSSERAKMVALFHQLGPDAPTLCEGWTTRDLVTHLWVRENRPDAAAGMFLSAFKPRLEKESAKVARRDFDELVDAWGRGPAKFNPARFLDAQQNLGEHFIHHEDIRRANGETEPRDFSAAVQKKLHRFLKIWAKFSLRKSTQPVILQPDGLPRIVVADKHGVADRGDRVVRVSGEVGELLLWAYGRDAVQVTITGDESAIEMSTL